MFCAPLRKQAFLSTLSLRRATRAESDYQHCNAYFYPRSPCGERLIYSRAVKVGLQFLSTLSLRRATLFCFIGALSAIFLSTLSLRRATSVPCVVSKRGKFLSTLSLRRATPVRQRPCFIHEISIHALLAESDSRQYRTGTRHRHFYPRSPCGERPDTQKGGAVWINFYPRSPCGERRGGRIRQPRRSRISIHALLAESDCTSSHQRRSSAGISIHALLAESDDVPTKYLKLSADFYPRSPCGERRMVCLRPG